MIRTAFMQCNISVTDAQDKKNTTSIARPSAKYHTKSIHNLTKKVTILSTNAGKLGLMLVRHKYQMWFNLLKLWVHDPFKPVEVRRHWTSVALQNFFVFCFFCSPGISNLDIYWTKASNLCVWGVTGPWAVQPFIFTELLHVDWWNCQSGWTSFWSTAFTY